MSVASESEPQNELPLVSVIMMAYNHAAYIAQAIDSVMVQERDFPMELLIGEDCSSDGTREIALDFQRRFPDVVKVITAETNVGSLENYRRLLRAARGRFIAYIDGDDYWLQEKLARQVAFLEHNHECVAVFTNADAVSSSGQCVGAFNDVGTQRFDLAALLRRGNFLCNSSMLFRASLVEDQLGLPDSAIDYQAHLLRARRGDLVQLGDFLVAYRVQAEGSMVSRANDRVRELYWQAITSVSEDEVSAGDMARGLADFLRRVIFRALGTRRWSLVRQWAPRVFARSPYGRLRTGALTLHSIVRIGAKELIGRWRGRGRGDHSKVLYRR